MKWIYFTTFVIFLTFIAWCVNDVRQMFHTVADYKMNFNGEPIQ